MKKAVGYIRVSTAGQAEEGVSLASQRERIEAWAKANGYVLAAILADEGLSGKRADNRPGLQAAIALACREKGALVSYSLSRIARSTTDAIAIANRLEKADADLVSLSEQLDTTGPMGRFVFTVLAAVGQLERDMTASRTRDALGFKKAHGEAYGPTPLGRRRVGARLEDDAAELATVDEIRTQRAAGHSLRAIAADLTRRGVPTKRGGAWFASTVRHVVGNSLYGASA